MVKRFFSGRSAGSGPLMAYLGQHKCGSTWLNLMTVDLCKAAGIACARLSNRANFKHDLGKFVREKGLGCIAWNNAEWSIMKGLDFRGFHVVRDPRDILVSAYYSHKKTHPTEEWPQLAQVRPFLEAAEFEDALFIELGFIPDVFRRLREWDISDERVLNLRLEDLSQDPENILRQAYTHIGLFDAGLTEERFQQVLAERDFEKLSGGRKKGEEDTSSHFRKGVAGDWRNHFTERHIRYFKAAMNDILVKYGYEQDDQW